MIHRLSLYWPSGSPAGFWAAVSCFLKKLEIERSVHFEIPSSGDGWYLRYFLNRAGLTPEEGARRVLSVTMESFQQKEPPESTEASPALALFFVPLSLSDIVAAKEKWNDLATRGRTRPSLYVCVHPEGKTNLTPALAAELLEIPAFDAHLPLKESLLWANTPAPLQGPPPPALNEKLADLARIVLTVNVPAISAREGRSTQEAARRHVTRSLVSHLWAKADRFSEPGFSLERAIREEMSRLLASLDGVPWSEPDRAAVEKEVHHHLSGLGPLQPFMDDPSVTDVMVNGPASIYVAREGRIHATDVCFDSPQHVRTLVERVCAWGGRRADWSSPCSDVGLPDGSRANIVMEPVSLQGATLTIRRFQKNMLRLDDLISRGTLNAAEAAALREAVMARKNIVVAGNTGSGKTTLLNILSAEILDEERIVTLEDTPELQLQKPNLVRLQTRPANAEGKGEIRLADLVVNALRMRPDRLIVGECRGAEVIPMLQALNTGHDGSLTTLHANSAQDALQRLETLVLLGAPSWPVEVIRRQIFSSLHMIVYLKREGERRRLTELKKLEPNTQTLEPLLQEALVL